MSISAIKMVVIGGICLIFAAFSAKDLIKKSGWPETPAEVIAVKTECLMESTEHKIVYKTTSRAEISCDMVDAFKALYSEQEWTVNQKFHGTLRVGAGAIVVQAAMELDKHDGREPRPGDKLTVLQNPANPGEIAKAGQAGIGLSMTLGAAIIGSLCLFLVFRSRRPARPASTANFIDAARVAALAAAEAQAKRGATSERAMPAAATAPTRSPFYPAPRTGFGRGN